MSVHSSCLQLACVWHSTWIMHSFISARHRLNSAATPLFSHNARCTTNPRGRRAVLQRLPLHGRALSTFNSPLESRSHSQPQQAISGLSRFSKQQVDLRTDRRKHWRHRIVYDVIDGWHRRTANCGLTVNQRVSGRWPLTTILRIIHQI